MLACLLAAGCGSDDGSSEPEITGPLPVGGDSAAAYTERFLAHNPHALARPEHLVAVDLEPVFAGADDTCAAEEGVDCVPYFFEQPTLVTFAIDEDMSFVERLVLRDERGTELLRYELGDFPAEALVDPGDYVVEVHHARAGEAGAPSELVFLRPNPPAEEGEEGLGVAAAEAGVATLNLQASNNCVRCKFDGSTLEKVNWDGADLVGSTFNGARFIKASLRGAKLAGAKFLDIRAGPGTSRTKDYVTNFDADFSGAHLEATQFTFAVDQNTEWAFLGVFRNATLDAAVFNNSRCEVQRCNKMNGDFRSAHMHGVEMSEVIFASVSVCPAHARSFPVAMNFQGADMTGALITSSARREFSYAIFGLDKDTGKQTILKDVDLQRMNFVDGDFSDTDLTGADLRGVNFSDSPLFAGICTLTEATKPKPANLARAILSGAKIENANFRGTNLSGAKIDGIIPPALAETMDFTGTNFAGVAFNGIDLSSANLSKAVAFDKGGLPNFAGAKLSNGSRGVDLTGQKFPHDYTVFKGVDLSGANLNRVHLYQANLEKTKLNGANLIGATLSFVNLHGAEMQGAHFGVQPGTDGVAASLRGAFMTDVDLTDADLRSVDLTAAHLYGDTNTTKLLRVKLDSADLSRAICSGALFSGTFNATVFNGAQLVDANFNGATLTNTKFDDAYLQGADFSNAASVKGISLINAAVSAAAGTWTFTEQNGRPYTLSYGATKLGPIATQEGLGIRCPNGTEGPCCPDGNLAACLSAKLKPKESGPYPPIPACKPAREYCYENCMKPPNFNKRPPCR